MDTIILAGGKPSSEWMEQAGTPDRSMAPINGKPMVGYVVEAIQNAGITGKLIIVGSEYDCDTVIKKTGGKDFIESITNGLEASSEEFIILATCDLPFLTSEAVSDFVEKALASDCDLAWAIAPLNICKEKYPQMKRTAIKIKEGVYTGGNLALAKRSFIINNLQIIRETYNARKKPLKLASLLGWGLLAKFILAQVIPTVLSLKAIENRVGDLLGGKLNAIISQYPEIATDIDTVDHWRIALDELKNNT